jgi:isoquinoline 1-oxidoreductase alpha subunit
MGDRPPSARPFPCTELDVELTINGKPTTVDAPADMPLLWALRDVVGLTGTKFGCGIAQCGACTVHVNGAPTRSCSITVGAAQGREITTIEGLAKGTVDHAVQQAWAELNVPQCGYCQAGQVMTAAAFIEKNSNPTDAQIDAAMQGNLCRCGTYVRIRAAIKRAAEIHRGATA